MNALDTMYKILIKQNGIIGKVNNVDCKFLLTECQDSTTNGLDVLTISTDQPLEQGYFVNINNDIYLVIDKKNETIAYQSYNVGTIQKCNHINKFVSSDVIYQCPSICTNITKGKLGLIYESAGITEANGVWCFITQQNDITKKIGIGTRFIINGNAWKCTSLDRVTDEGILYVILRLDNINTGTDDLINEVAGGLDTHTYTISLSETSKTLKETETYQIVATCCDNGTTVTNPIITYTSSDPNIVSVDSTGVVTGTLVGSAIITCTFKNVSVDLSITVNEKPSEPVVSYTYNFSQGASIRRFVTSLLTTTKTIDGVADSTFHIDYSFDSLGQSLISSGKIVVTRKSDVALTIRNASVTTNTVIHLTVIDSSNGSIIADTDITLTGM